MKNGKNERSRTNERSERNMSTVTGKMRGGIGRTRGLGGMKEMKGIRGI